MLIRAPIGHAVLHLDLAGVTQGEILVVVQEHCAEFGTVTQAVYDDTLGSATVTMSTTQEAMVLHKYLGDSIVDRTVTIYLDQSRRP